MNIIFYSLLIFGFSYLILKLIANVSSKKISKFTRLFIFLFSLILAFLFAFGGRFLLSLPLILLSLAVVKLKGLTIYQIFALYRLIQTLRMSGRFSFNQKSQSSNYSNLSLEEAYRILNLNKNKKVSKNDVEIAYKKIQKKIHPDVSPETSRLSSIVNEAKDVVLKSLT